MKKILFALLLVLSFSVSSKAIFQSSNSIGLKVADIDFKTACSAGLIEGCKMIRKFGINGSLLSGAKKDVWGFGSSVAPAGNVDYTYPADGTAPIDTISSSSALDVGEVLVSGLDINGADTVQLVTLQGQAKVLLPTPLWRSYRFQNVQAANTADRSIGFAGNVYIYEDTAIVAGVPTDATKVRAYVFNGNNKTQMTQYCIPAGWTGFSLGTSMKLSKKQSSAVVVQVWARAYGRPFTLEDTSAVNSLGTGAYSSENFIPNAIPALTDIVVAAESDATVGIAVSYELILLKNSTWGLE